MEFPPGIHTGDGGGFDMHISNQVYNKIRNFSTKEDKRKHRIVDKEERAVAEQAVDPKTRVLLFKLVNGGVLDAINGVISTGKEAVIMHADGGPGPDEGPEIPLNVPKECAVKVFKTTLNEFKTREKYIRDDYRWVYDIYYNKKYLRFYYCLIFSFDLFLFFIFKMLMRIRRKAAFKNKLLNYKYVIL